MKNSNLKKLSRKEQTEIKGSLQMNKCKNTYPKCNPGECCISGFCHPSPILECEPIILD